MAGSSIPVAFCVTGLKKNVIMIQLKTIHFLYHLSVVILPQVLTTQRLLLQMNRRLLVPLDVNACGNR